MNDVSESEGLCLSKQQKVFTVHTRRFDAEASIDPQ